jgi:hydroxymethylbilane synthase
MAERERTFRFVTRPSALARQQTQSIIQALQIAWPTLTCLETVISTRGDRQLDQPLPEIGGKGLFTQELEAVILSGQADAAVHSFKDLPTHFAKNLVIGATSRRADARDVLVSTSGYTLETLPVGARLGTSSPRRAAQLLAYRPDLRIENLRGNIDSRLNKASQYDAIVLAAAGLIRLGLEAHITQWLPLEVMLPAPGQGALAVQCRADHSRLLRWLAAIDDLSTRQCVEAERAFLAGLGGGCALPVAAHASYQDGQLVLEGLAASTDGQRVIRLKGEGQDGPQLGIELARQALQAGAAELIHSEQP